MHGRSASKKSTQHKLTLSARLLPPLTPDGSDGSRVILCFGRLGRRGFDGNFCSKSQCQETGGPTQMAVCVRARERHNESKEEVVYLVWLGAEEEP